jgi:threonine dehydrogenase-like Zn-dependent dehydrogenase
MSISDTLQPECKAAVLVGDRHIELQSLPVPDTLPRGFALLEVEGSGMCGSDIEQYHGVTAAQGVMNYPAIPGHEPVGRIVKMDDEARRRWGLDLGMRVAVHGTAPCGVCVACQAGQRCHDAFYYGFHSISEGAGLWGGYAQYMVITPNTKLYELPDELTIEDAVLFNPLAAGMDWVARLSGIQVGDDILILGPGQRGLASVIAAKEAGADKIFVTGLNRDRFKLDLAAKLGATHTLVADESDIVEEIRRATAGRGVSRIVDTTPMAFEPIADAIRAAQPDATLVLGGLKGDKPMPDFPLDAVIHKRLHLIGALSTTDWAVKQAIRIITSGRYPLQLLHTHTLPIERLEHAIHMLEGKVAGETPLHITMVPRT